MLEPQSHYFPDTLNRYLQQKPSKRGNYFLLSRLMIELRFIFNRISLLLSILMINRTRKYGTSIVYSQLEPQYLRRLARHLADLSLRQLVTYLSRTSSLFSTTSTDRQVISNTMHNSLMTPRSSGREKCELKGLKCGESK